MGKPVKGMRAFNSHERRAIRAQLLEKYGLYCQICLLQGKNKEKAIISLASTYDDDSFSIDHIVALADGGTNTVDNMHPTHIACNERKGSLAKGGRVRTNRRPRTQQESVKHVTGVRLAYSTSTR